MFIIRTAVCLAFILALLPTDDPLRSGPAKAASDVGRQDGLSG
jgi:hypothetical protein